MPDLNPFQGTEPEPERDLALRAGNGDAAALDQLIRRHYPWILNLCRRFTLNPADAADLAQEAAIRIVTRLAQFEGRSAFRSWAYRIVVRCCLDAKRGRMEQAITGFDRYGAELDSLPLSSLTLEPELDPERALIVEEVRNGCMLGMLLCLDREQRITYILGDIFEAPSDVAAEILDLTPASFRKRLQRARTDLTAFMQDKCGLVNAANPCRCEKKTRAFIDAGWVDPRNRKFADAAWRSLSASAREASPTLDHLVSERYARLFREHPLYPSDELADALGAMLRDPDVTALLQDRN